MKRSFTTITSVWLSSVLFVAPLRAFQTDLPKDLPDLTAFETIEAGLANEANVKPSMFYLAQGDYARALAEVNKEPEGSSSWLRSYLTDLNRVFPALVKSESEHFVLWTPADQKFLAEYALPSLEKNAAHIESRFGYRSPGKVRVEIYPTKEDFSAASTLSVETLERSGAIGICKFHRLMITSPQSLPVGYRWLDALSHEYMHLIINELSHSRAELWLHEGTARYFETSYRLQSPMFLTPDQKTKLLDALEQKTLVPFEKMSPSMVYLKDQEQVTLAFAQVSYAVSILVAEKGVPAFAVFLRSLRSKSFADAFKANYRMSPAQFETMCNERLSKEKWQKSQGTMSDEVSFSAPDENKMIGADSQAQVRLGDRMRRQSLMEAALIEYEKALQVEPDNATILLKAAKTHIALGQTNDAIAKLRRAVEMNPNYETPQIELALLVGPEEAFAHLMEAIAINPFDPRIKPLLEKLKPRSGSAE